MIHKVDHIEPTKRISSVSFERDEAIAVNTQMEISLKRSRNKEKERSEASCSLLREMQRKYRVTEKLLVTSEMNGNKLKKQMDEMEETIEIQVNVSFIMSLQLNQFCRYSNVYFSINCTILQNAVAAAEDVKEFKHNKILNKMELHSCNILQWERSKHKKEVKNLKNKEIKLEMEAIAQETMHKNKYDIMMTKHEKECDARAAKHEEECNAITEEYKRKLENERSLHVQECAKLRKEQK